MALLRHNNKLRLQRSVKSRVRFRSLSTMEIEGYIASGEWRGKAGGYAVQGLGRRLVQELDGPWDNVVGLPRQVLREMLAEAGYSTSSAVRKQDD